MNLRNFLIAIETLTPFHSTEIMINKPVDGFVGTLGKDKWTIDVRNCVPSAVIALTDAGFSLSMHNGWMSVDTIGNIWIDSDNISTEEK